jgi:ubiquinone/menaquinone biosynthesis C-methylase UbiE
MPDGAKPEYEYHGLMAALWDLFRGDTSNWSDRFFYREVIATAGQPVLDVGCGTGRLLLDYLADGINIDGVDNSPEMLARCREKATAIGLSPTLYEQTMQTLDLPRRYRTILVPSSSFQLLTDPADAAEAMQRFWRHLEPGGTLAMSLMALWQEGEPIETDWHLAGEAVLPEDGATARRWSRAWYDPANQWEYTEDRYEILREGKVVTSERHLRSPATRSYTQEQARALYEVASLTDIRLLREFTMEPALPSDTLFCVMGSRPSAG